MLHRSFLLPGNLSVRAWRACGGWKAPLCTSVRSLQAVLLPLPASLPTRSTSCACARKPRAPRPPRPHAPAAAAPSDLSPSCPSAIHPAAPVLAPSQPCAPSCAPRDRSHFGAVLAPPSSVRFPSCIALLLHATTCSPVSLRPVINAASVPSIGVYLPTYDAMLSALHSPDRPLGAVAPLIAGSSARALSCVATAPLELARTQLQSASAPYGGLSSALTSAFAGNGVRGLFAGLAPTLLRDVPFSALYWQLVETIRAHIVPGFPGMGPGFAAAGHATCGLVSGSLAAVVTTPFDVVKTRMQAGASSTLSMTSTVRKLHSEAGFRGFFTGAVPRAARAGPSCAAVLALYEGLKRRLST